MSTLYVFFLSILHLLALAWSTIHADAANGRSQRVRTIAREVKVEYRDLRNEHKVYASTRASGDSRVRLRPGTIARALQVTHSSAHGSAVMPYTPHLPVSVLPAGDPLSTVDPDGAAGLAAVA